jgi:hypothetical protein
MRRYFYSGQDRGAFRKYLYWYLETENNTIQFININGTKGVRFFNYSAEDADFYVRSDSWVEIPAAEAVLMG